MKTKKRIPIEPSENLKKELKWAEKNNSAITIDGVSVTPPFQNKSNWRLRSTINGKTVERSGGKTYSTVNAALIELRNQIEYANRGAIGLPEKGHLRLDETVRHYLKVRGPQGKWKFRTVENRTDDFNHLIKLGEKYDLTCQELNGKWMREYLGNATASQIRATSLEGVLRTFIEWGYSQGYFNKEQYDVSRIVKWSPPEGSNYVSAPSRREQSKKYFGDENQEGGQVPTHDQVIQLAQETQKRYLFGEALIHVSANLGTRAAETLLYTASKSIAKSGKGNLVDLENGNVNVTVQVNDDPSLDSKTTKNGKRRKVVIPRVENIATKFDVFSWLEQRSEQALKEQKQGTNPLALIFPDKKGDVFTPSRLDTQVIRPATDALGWQMPAYVDAKGTKRTMRRFTLHSMRDRFGVTAAEEWKYTDGELLQQGSWSDLSTVRKFYMGFTDVTQEAVHLKHRGKLLKENK